MNAPARTTPAMPILRNAAGEPPLGVGGLAFRDDQGEMFEHDNPRFRAVWAKVGVLELETGKWLAHPPGFRVDVRVIFDDRAEALQSAVEEVINRAHTYMGNAETGAEGTACSADYGNQVIHWAKSLLAAGSPAAEEINPETNPNRALGVKTAVEEITDPVVAELYAAYLKRKVYPAGHCFSRTNPIVNGQMVNMATCECGGCVISFKWGSNDRVTAAEEAHWQKFDHLPEKVDGRGFPINAEKRAAATKGDNSGQPKSRRQRGAPKAGDTPELANAALPEPASVALSAEGAGSPPSQPDAGGLTSASIVADVPQQLRSEPAPDASPEGAGSTLSALRAIAAGEQVDGPIVLDLARQGLVHATTTRLLVTEAGKALLKSSDGGGNSELGDGAIDHRGLTGDDRKCQPLPREGETTPLAEYAPVPSETEQGAPIGAGSVADAKCQECEPFDYGWGILQDEYLVGIMARTGRVDDLGSVQDALKMSSDGLTAPEPIAADQNVAVTAPAIVDDDDDLSIEWPSYDAFLEDKIVTAPLRGIEVARDSLHPWLKPHCKDLTLWALRLGCAAIFANFGLHKTAMQLEWCRQLVKHTGSPSLCVVPLGVRHGFIKEALQLGMDVRFIRTNAEFDDLYCEGVRYFLTNYESIREGKLDPNLFIACSLDEASVLRSFGSKTYQEFLPLFSKVEFKLVATATPSPNRYKELIHYAGFLGVMDTGLALTRWFQRNSEKAGDLTLYPHKEDEFWMWVHSWAAFLQRPSELGYSDEGYELPPLKLTWHEVPADHSKAEPERDGQGVMFRHVANSLQDAARSRRDSLSSRIQRMVDIIAQDPDSHRVIWHDLEAEREAIEQALPGVVTIMGSMDIDEREERLRAFEEGETKHFATKPILSGSGSNFQYHCHKAIYVALPGYGYKFNDFLQSLYRLQRFGQLHLVEVDIIYSEDERAGRAALEEKWQRDAEMRTRMSDIIKRHGLNTLPLRDALLRTIGVKRVEIRGKHFVAINNDAVAECRTWPDNSVDEIITSIPFGNQYEYSARYEDFGHSDDSGHFWSQMDFLTTELLRMLKPGRLACIHVKDRVLFGSVTGAGVPTVSPFHCEAVMHYRAHGFDYCGMVTVVTDVVRENNQTYRLGWSEMCKDGTKMGVGMPEYILLLRKPQSDRTRGYADVPVTKEKWDGENDGCSRARWQIVAHDFWRSSGDRHLRPEEFAQCSSADLAKLFSKTSAERIYDHEAHVKIGEALERTGTLPATFMAIAPGSHHQDVWSDVNRMRTLNMLQQRKGAEMHLCPLQFDIVDRLIERYSNEGDLIFDPFGGLMTVPYRALLKKRRGAATELSATYFLDGVHYLHMAEEKMETPQLFDLATFDAANLPPPSDMMESEA
jgi:hypothetical protein